jgi:hypothetical protein
MISVLRSYGWRYELTAVTENMPITDDPDESSWFIYLLELLDKAMQSPQGTVELPTTLEGVYHWSTAEIGASYLVMGITMVVGSISRDHFSNWRRAHVVKAVGEDNIFPEGRLVDQIWGVSLYAGGLLMFGWFVDKSIHPAVTLLSIFLGMFTCGYMLGIF